MGENTKIEWTKHTFNPWWGCTRVSPACDHCYAATLAKRFEVGWGKSSPVRTFGDKHWNDPIRWDRAAAKAGVPARVFCASMADVFERREGEIGKAMDAQRARLWPLIERTPNLRWLLLTKRPKNVLEMVPEAWRSGLPSNIWMGTTVEDQRRADERIPHLLRIPAAVRFLSMEPLLGPVELPGGATVDGDATDEIPGIHWVIAGGESGAGARPSHPDWFRSLRDQCAAADVPFHFKQWGNYRPELATIAGEPAPVCGWKSKWGTLDRSGDWSPLTTPWNGRQDHDSRHNGEVVMVDVGKSEAGRLLDGRTWDEVPHG